MLKKLWSINNRRNCQCYGTLLEIFRIDPLVAIVQEYCHDPEISSRDFESIKMYADVTQYRNLCLRYTPSKANMSNFIPRVVISILEWQERLDIEKIDKLAIDVIILNPRKQPIRVSNNHYLDESRMAFLWDDLCSSKDSFMTLFGNTKISKISESLFIKACELLKAELQTILDELLHQCRKTRCVMH